jgi:hypothetical protein
VAAAVMNGFIDVHMSSSQHPLKILTMDSVVETA